MTLTEWSVNSEGHQEAYVMDGNEEMAALTVFPAHWNDEWHWHIDCDYPHYVDARTKGEERAKELAWKTALLMLGKEA